MSLKKILHEVFETGLLASTKEIDYVYDSRNPKNVVALKDNRTFRVDKLYHIYPIAITKENIYIVCPYCGQIHIHSNRFFEPYGFRIPHCNEPKKESYFIEWVKEFDKFKKG